MLNRVLQGEDTPLALGLVADHHTLVANNGREDGTKVVITGETGFAHASLDEINLYSLIIFIKHNL